MSNTKKNIDHFVLIAADADKRRLALPSAMQLAKYRLNRKEWGLKERTRYRKHMKPGDKVLIYLSGTREFAQHFIAEAIILDGPHPNDGGTVDSPDLRTSIFSEYKIILRDIRFFEKPICVRNFLGKFEFVAPHRVKMWRIYFQGGAIHLSQKDFRLVLRSAK